jgi:hypothetical protein
MALTEDQTALLRLLLAGDTYERVADVLGTTPDEVRDRAHAAASELEGESNGEFAPEAVNARLATLEGAVPPEVVAARPPAQGRRWGPWIAAGAGLVVLIVVGVVLASSGGGGDEGGSSPPAPDREDVVPVKMNPVGNSGAGGTIAIVRVGDQPAVDLAIQGLRPTPGGRTYVLWFVGTGNRSLPVAFQAVGRDGRLTGRAPIPTAAASLLPSFDTAELTLTAQKEAAAAVQRAGQAGTLPEPVGATVLRGALR